MRAIQGSKRRFVFNTVHELAAAIRLREISAEEVVQAFLSQIAQHNTKLNAIVTLNIEGAQKRAREADAAITRGELWGPFHGVPVTFKDSIATAGLRTTSGYPDLANFCPTADATVVARLRSAGAIVLGKTNLPALAGDVQTNNAVFGRTNNPWNLEFTPGGSTGGGAAAVAAGFTPLEIGSDIGGSVRIPAHYCGVFGLKPTDHRVPVTGHIPELPGRPRGVRHMNVIGPLARSVQDLSLALSVMAGPDGEDSEIPPVPLECTGPKNLHQARIAWTDNFGGLPVAHETRKSLERLAIEIAGEGASVEYVTLNGLDFCTVWETWGELAQMERASSMSVEEEIERERRINAGSHPEEPLLRGAARRLNANVRQYAATLRQRDQVIFAVDRLFEAWDLLLCPVTVTTALRHCTPGTPITVDGIQVPYWIGAMGFCMPFNLSGHPAVTVPLTVSSEGLPIGMQVVGARWTDMRLLSLAAELSDIIGPVRHPPGY